MSEMKKKWRYGYEKDNNKKAIAKTIAFFTYFCFNIYVYCIVFKNDRCCKYSDY